MRSLLYTILLCLFISSCKTPEARRPVSHSSGSYINASIARNKEINKAEEEAILEIIRQQPENEYKTSADGFWYHYEVKVDDSTTHEVPEVGDLISFTYNISSISGEEIVSKEVLGVQTYQIDQSNQELIPGLRAGLKLMREGETVTFLFPSYNAFGYYGYEDKIGMNRPIKSTVTLNSIKLKNPEN